MDDVIDLGSGGKVEFSLQLSDYLGVIFTGTVVFVAKRLWSAAGAHLSFIESQEATLSHIKAVVDDTKESVDGALINQFKTILDILKDDIVQTRKTELLDSAVFDSLLAMAETNPEWLAALRPIERKLGTDFKELLSARNNQPD